MKNEGMKKSESVIISKFSLSMSASKIYFIWEKRRVKR